MQAPRAFSSASNINDDEASKRVSDKQYLLKRHKNGKTTFDVKPLAWALLMHYVPEQLEIHLERFFLLCFLLAHRRRRRRLKFWESRLSSLIKVLFQFICKGVAGRRHGRAANKKPLIFRLSMIYRLRTLVSEIGWFLLRLSFARESLAVEKEEK